MNGPPTAVTCVECGADAHLTSFIPEDEPLDPGTPLAYVCGDCGERLDIIWEEGDEG